MEPNWQKVRFPIGLEVYSIHQFVLIKCVIVVSVIG